MNPMPMERDDRTPEVFAHRREQQLRRIREAEALVFYAHSRTGQLARFLQRMADRIDPTGEARGTMR
jgi:hypothetical protein